MVALARLEVSGLRGNGDAANAPAYREDLKNIAARVVTRVTAVEASAADETAEDLEAIIDRWVTRAQQGDGLVYESTSGTGSALLEAATPEAEPVDAYSTMWSLRDVDAESNLFFAKIP